ncbi:MAG: HU family DNA-binding protein [Bradymonadia bacterium]|jgi:DNA-binding protein HU-beta
MTKKELISAVQESAGQDLTKKQVDAVVDAVFSTIAGAIKDDARYSHPGFGTFTVKSRAARTGRNPRTGKEIKIEASKSIGFKAAPDLKNSL